VANNAALRRDGEALLLTGALDRAGVIALWPQIGPSLLSGARVLDLRGVDRVDSAGVALLAELVARIRTGASTRQQAPTLLGAPAGLEELTAAYRLTSQLEFQASPSPAVN
jgi:phospholipid transport system transporter-binding protein